MICQTRHCRVQLGHEDGTACAAGPKTFDEREVRRARRDLRRSGRDIAALRAMAQRVVDQDECEHRFGDRRRANADARIVAAMRLDVAALPRVSIVRRGRRMLDVGLIAIDTTMSCPVEMPPSMPPALFEETLGRHLVAVLGAELLDAREARADLDAFHGVDAHHGLGDVRIEAIVQRLAEAEGTPLAMTVIRAPTDSPTCAACPCTSRAPARAASGAKNGLSRTSSQSTKAICRAELREIAANLDAVLFAQPLLRDRSGGHRGAVKRADDRPPPRWIADAVLCQ